MSSAKTSPSAPEVRRVLETLKSAIRLLGYSVRDIERALGYSFGYLSRVFSGTIELKMEHVLDIARALEMAPEELLAFVYPSLKDPASPAAYELWQRVGGYPPTGRFVIRNINKDGVTEEELERALRRTLGRVLSDLSGHLADQPLTSEDSDEPTMRITVDPGKPPRKTRKPKKS
jgi:transcriptional regulator with XRE-family HTH domain